MSTQTLDVPVASRNAAHLTISPVTPVIGAEVSGIDLRQPLDDFTIDQLKNALHQWKVLFFRDQPISDQDQLRFGRYFGPLTPAHPIAEGLPEHPEIWERSASEYKRHRPDVSVVTARPPRDYKGWHIDITFVANPNKYSILRGVEIPAYGGDTLWSNLVAAYEGLSPKIKELIDDLQAVHGTSSYDRGSGDKPRKGPFVSLHPLVRVHPETREKALFFNPGTTTHIIGLRERESQAILDLLAEEVTRPEYQVRFHWSPNAIAFWDNQVTAHAGPIDYAHFTATRTVRRITVAGDLPEGPDGFRSRPIEGELFGIIG
ncbi:MAG: TauD/TfdA family dioxygenase [Capsulimonadales bacterium]|nr:TauD/TfdA family dioxygenase [Capsulimonadales bacterium]